MGGCDAFSVDCTDWVSWNSELKSLRLCKFDEANNCVTDIVNSDLAEWCLISFGTATMRIVTHYTPSAGFFDNSNLSMTQNWNEQTFSSLVRQHLPHNFSQLVIPKFTTNWRKSFENLKCVETCVFS